MKEVIRKIELSENIDGETKLLALCQIDLLKQGAYPTPLGVEFWAELEDKL